MHLTALLLTMSKFQRVETSVPSAATKSILLGCIERLALLGMLTTVPLD